MANSAISTGLPSIDRITGGLRTGELFVLAGRPGVGKSAIAMNIAAHASIEEGVPAAVFSPKMPCHRVLRRLQLAHPGFRATSTSRLANGKLLVDDSCGLSIIQIARRAHQLRRDEGIRLVVIDYIQLIRCGQGSPQAQDAARISWLLKCMSEGIAVLLICAMPRLVVAGIGPFHFVASPWTSLEKEADVVGLLSRKTEEIEDSNAGSAVSAILKIVRHKSGEAGEAQLKYRKDCYRFEDAAD